MWCGALWQWPECVSLIMFRALVSRRLMSTAAAGKVGFVGLGNMGRSMAENLLKKGHAVVVFDGTS